VATLLFILIVLAAVAKNWTLLRESFGSLAVFAITLNLAMLASGFVAARLARLSRKQSVTLGIESAVQNATLALVIASSVLENDALAVPGAVYGVLMYGGGLLFAFALRRYAEAPEAQPAATLRAPS
jgi:bile acid:Na+ symporter, BASS family